MKALISVVVLSLGLAATAQAAPISYGDVTGGGTFAGTTTSNSAWASENPVDGNEVNFWTFNGTAGDSLSIVINSLDGVFDAAFSLFYGAIDSMDLMFGLFDNNGDVGSAKFIAGTSPFGTAGNDASLLDIILADTGLFTIVVGGESFLSFENSYQYSLEVIQSAVSVPEPATLGLMVSALAAFGLSARRRQLDV